MSGLTVEKIIDTMNASAAAKDTRIAQLERDLAQARAERDAGRKQLEKALKSIKHSREADELSGWAVVNRIEPYIVKAIKRP
jgi:t-SNARE complex subunit (syntaxin)